MISFFLYHKYKKGNFVVHPNCKYSRIS